MVDLIGGPILPLPWLYDKHARPDSEIAKATWAQLDAAASWAWNRAYSTVMKALPYVIAAVLILIVWLLRDWIFPKPVYLVKPLIAE